MIRFSLCYLILVVLGSGCKKTKPVEPKQLSDFVTLNYTMYDSVLMGIDYMSGQSVVFEEHHTLNTDFSISMDENSEVLIYNLDTFLRFQATPLSFYKKKGGFPNLIFRNDSLSMNTHLGGVGYQNWKYIKCVKK